MIALWVVAGLGVAWLVALGLTALGLWAFARAMERNHEHRENGIDE